MLSSVPLDGTANFVDECDYRWSANDSSTMGFALEAQALPDAIHSDYEKIKWFSKAGETLPAKLVTRVSLNKKFSVKS